MPRRPEPAAHNCLQVTGFRANSGLEQLQNPRRAALAFTREADVTFYQSCRRDVPEVPMIAMGSNGGRHRTFITLHIHASRALIREGTHMANLKLPPP